MFYSLIKLSIFFERRGIIMLDWILCILITINIIFLSILIIQSYKNPNLKNYKFNIGLALLQIILILLCIICCI